MLEVKLRQKREALEQQKRNSQASPTATPQSTSFAPAITSTPRAVAETGDENVYEAYSDVANATGAPNNDAAAKRQSSDDVIEPPKYDFHERELSRSATPATSGPLAV